MSRLIKSSPLSSEFGSFPHSHFSDGKTISHPHFSGWGRGPSSPEPMLFTTVMPSATQSLELRNSSHIYLIIIVIIDNISAYSNQGRILRALHIFMPLIITMMLRYCYHFQMTQMRHRKVRWQAQSHTAAKWQSCKFNLYSLPIRVWPLNHSDVLLL